MRVYFVSKKRKVLHAGEQGATLLTSEACNLDDSDKQEYTDLAVARSIAKRDCKRCMKEPA